MFQIEFETECFYVEIQIINEMTRQEFKEAVFGVTKGKK